MILTFGHYVLMFTWYCCRGNTGGFTLTKDSKCHTKYFHSGEFVTMVIISVMFSYQVGIKQVTIEIHITSQTT